MLIVGLLAILPLSWYAVNKNFLLQHVKVKHVSDLPFLSTT
jgi:hypothetical protein